MSNDPPSRNVGYKKPPLHSRFRKGRSGNPAGARRRAKGLAALLETALDASAGHTRRPRTRREAIVAGLVEQAAAGDLHAIKLLLDLIHKTGLAAPPALAADDDDPRAQLLRELERLAAATAINGIAPGTPPAE